MAPISYNLTTSNTAIIGVDGTAQMTMGPSRVGERWIVYTISTLTDSNPAQFTPLLYVRKNGFELVDGTYNANNDTSGQNNFELRQGEKLVFQLEDGEPGKAWTISVTGKGYAL